VVKCPVCQAEHPENTIFCDECGSYLLGGNGKETDLLPIGGVAWMNREETSGAPGVDVTFPLSLKLTIPESGREVEVPLTEEVNIGRLDMVSASFPDVDLTRDDALDKGVSRHHAKITRRRHEVFIEDLGSMNGTFVNCKKLTPYLPEALRNGDQLQLGKLILRVSFTKIEQPCENCREYKKDVFRRADISRLLCSDCYAKALASNRPSKYMFVPSLKAAGQRRTHSHPGGAMKKFKASDDL
jgi:hypothetical protein